MIILRNTFNSSNFNRLYNFSSLNKSNNFHKSLCVVATPEADEILFNGNNMLCF